MNYEMRRQLNELEKRIKDHQEHATWLRNDTKRFIEQSEKVNQAPSQAPVEEPPKPWYEMSSQEFSENYKRYGEPWIDGMIEKLAKLPEFQHHQPTNQQAPVVSNSAPNQPTPEQITKAMKESASTKDALKKLGMV